MTQSIVERNGTREEWNAYVGRRPDATQYHAHEWLEVISRAFGHEAFPLVARKGSGIAGVFPLVAVRSFLFGRILVSLPFVNYGGVLADDAETESQLWRAATEIARETGSSYLEARHLVPRPLGNQRKQHKSTMILGLQRSVDDQWRVFNAKLRNQIRKAERSHLTARSGGSELLGAFYEVFARSMRDLGTPVYGKRFFEEVFRSIPDRARVLVVEGEGKPVAAGVALTYRETVEVPWAGSLREWRPRCPNNLLYWEAIRQAIQNGFRHFDFGRSTPGDGPYRFKEQWGAEPVPLSWEYWLAHGTPVPDLSPKNAKFQTAIEIWKRLPLAVTKWLGPTVVRGIP